MAKSGAQEEAACGVSRNAERSNAAFTDEGVAAVPVWRGRLSFDVVVRLGLVPLRPAVPHHEERERGVRREIQAHEPNKQMRSFPIHRVKGAHRHLPLRRLCLFGARFVRFDSVVVCKVSCTR